MALCSECKLDIGNGGVAQEGGMLLCLKCDSIAASRETSSTGPLSPGVIVQATSYEAATTPEAAKPAKKKLWKVLAECVLLLIVAAYALSLLWVLLPAIAMIVLLFVTIGVINYGFKSVGYDSEGAMSRAWVCLLAIGCAWGFVESYQSYVLSTAKETLFVAIAFVAVVIIFFGIAQKADEYSKRIAKEWVGATICISFFVGALFAVGAYRNWRITNCFNSTSVNAARADWLKYNGYDRLHTGKSDVDERNRALFFRSKSRYMQALSKRLREIGRPLTETEIFEAELLRSEIKIVRHWRDEDQDDYESSDPDAYSR